MVKTYELFHQVYYGCTMAKWEIGCKIIKEGEEVEKFLERYWICQNPKPGASESIDVLAKRITEEFPWQKDDVIQNSQSNFDKGVDVVEPLFYQYFGKLGDKIISYSNK
ncbi:hypothetical protein ACFL1H_02510 [Nanoarchaeota archaeon]